MYVVGYPGSQTTWLAYMLAYCLNTEYSDLDSPNNIISGNEDLQSYLKGKLDHPSHQAQLGKVIRTNCVSISGQDQTPVVYMVRDGRDVMLSYYYNQQSSIGRGNPHVPQKTFFSKVYRKLEFWLSRFLFSRFLHNHVSEWVSHVETWLDYQPVAIIRYEDLLAIPEETLASLMMRLELQVSPEVIQQAVEIFKSKDLSNHQPMQHQKKPIGNPGDWEKYFSKTDSAYFQETAGKVLSILGYEHEI